MIRWARWVDETVRVVADTLADWQAAWMRMWNPGMSAGWLPSGREVLIMTGVDPEEVRERIEGLSGRHDRLRPGTRLVVTFQHSLEISFSSNARFLEVFDNSDWSPEIPHLCDPLPGDPRATPAWQERERILIDRSGRAAVGAVLAKRLLPDEAETARFLPRTGVGVGRGYFPLPESGLLPLPERLSKDGPFSAGDLAAVFGMAPQDAMPLLDELLVSGAISLVEP